MFKIGGKQAELEQLDPSIEPRAFKAEDLEERKQELLIELILEEKRAILEQLGFSFERRILKAEERKIVELVLEEKQAELEQLTFRLEQLNPSIEQLALKTEDLEKRKQELLDASTEIRGVDNLDERAKQSMLEAINASLEANAQEIEHVFDEIEEETSKIEIIKSNIATIKREIVVMKDAVFYSLKREFADFCYSYMEIQVTLKTSNSNNVDVAEFEEFAENVSRNINLLKTIYESLNQEIRQLSEQFVGCEKIQKFTDFLSSVNPHSLEANLALWIYQF